MQWQIAASCRLPAALHDCVDQQLRLPELLRFRFHCVPPVTSKLTVCLAVRYGSFWLVFWTLAAIDSRSCIMRPGVWVLWCVCRLYVCGKEGTLTNVHWSAALFTKIDSNKLWFPCCEWNDKSCCFFSLQILYLCGQLFYKVTNTQITKWPPFWGACRAL